MFGSDPVSSPSLDSSSIPCMMLGLVGLLGGGPSICGVSVEIRTQFCRRCPFLAFGLPFSDDGFARGWVSHWNGFPLLLRPESWVAFDGCRRGVIEFAEMSRNTLVFLRSAGEPLAETDVQLALRGVVTLRMLEKLFSEFSDETRLELIWSAVLT